MQGNGFKISAVLAFVLLSLYYLFPTVQRTLDEREIAAMSEDEATAYREANYDDLQATRERSLNLGLDLQGGMHVTLEVGAAALIRELADDRTDETFDEALRIAQEQSLESRDNFVDLFVAAIEDVRPNTRLARYFRNASDEINARSSNDEVAAVLKVELEEAVTRATQIVRQRVDRFGVTEPSIQKQGSNRIIVEMPGVTEPQRVRNLLRGTAKLEFRLMPDPGQVAQVAQSLVAYVDEGEEAEADSAATETEAAPDSTAAGEDSTTALDVAALAEAEQEAESAVRDRQLSELLTIVPGQSVPYVGQVAVRDTAAVGAILRRPDVARLIPPTMDLLFSARPVEGLEEEAYWLLAVNDRVELEGDVVTDDGPDFAPFTNAPLVSLSMNTDGATRWAQLTGANIGRPVAIVLDGLVYTWPVIQSAITGGRTSIEGVTRTEAEDIVTVLKSGALPAPVQIVEERTVGPSLGQQAVTAGTRSLIIGFLLVVVFMGFYYRTAGLVAGVALVLNVLFIFGILAGFGATLTLPGMAGIVLTIGMAVDANVLIFERIREEMASGKTLKAAVQGGFEKALSAIADANITTFLIGVILYSFGLGPIQGFAVTLMAGIVTSLFTALVVTRLFLDYLVQGRGANVAFG
ncbi:MAG TPA: protein translocase subunit SecD [Bacteroidetes bacterium]|nr:protein translocase subunit SecD [Bacteroidota bacterium]